MSNEIRKKALKSMATDTGVSKLKEKAQKRKDKFEEDNYTKNIQGEWSWKPGKLEKATQHLAGEKRIERRSKLKDRLDQWKKRREQE